MAGIVHKAVKVSGEKGLATEWNDDHKITGDIDQDQNQFLNQVIENRTDFPAGPIEGQIVYRSDLNVLYVYDGSSWVAHTPAIQKGTHYWSCAGTHFNTAHPDVDDVVYDFGDLRVTGSTDWLIGKVALPNGATVTNVIVYGNAATEDTTWEMRRATTAAGGFGTVMATHQVNTADATITNPIIDNETYSYFLFVDTLSADDRIHGARIIYTL